MLDGAFADGDLASAASARAVAFLRLCVGQTYIRTQWQKRITTLPTYTQHLLKQLEKVRPAKSKSPSRHRPQSGNHHCPAYKEILVSCLLLRCAVQSTVAPRRCRRQ